MTILAKMTAVRDDASSALLERDDVVRGMMLGLVARRHIFLLGPPGTAKSMTVDVMQERIAGAKRFKVLMTRFTTPEEVIGPVKLSALKADRYERATEGYLPDAHLAFLDECFKANSAILNSLLMLLNERKVRNGSQMVDAPLMTCVGASNELPQGDDLGALYDRFLMRFYVPALTEDASFASLLTMGTPTVGATVTLDELAVAQREAATVTLPTEVVEALVALRAKLSGDGITASDRRWRESLSLLRANAWLDGRSACAVEDICELRHVLWSDPNERAKVEQAVVGFAVPALARALEILDLASEQHRKVLAAKPGEESAKIEGANKFQAMTRDFDAIMRGYPAGQAPEKLKGMERKFKAMRREVGVAVVGGT